MNRIGNTEYIVGEDPLTRNYKRGVETLRDYTDFMETSDRRKKVASAIALLAGVSLMFAPQPEAKMLGVGGIIASIARYLD